LELARNGYFDGQRVELIDGEIFEMSPIRNAHAAAVSRLSAVLASLPADRFWARVQATLSLLGNLPDPDLAVVAGPITREGDFPTCALLVIEVSDTTLNMDRGKKMSLYAHAGIPEYWVVNLRDHQIEVYLKPVKDEAGHFGVRYGQCLVRKSGEAIAPQFWPSIMVPVAEIFS
jgi:Uma2 family endonuclease